MSPSTDRNVAIVALLLGLGALFFWIPNDVDTGLIETFRRQTYIGDALFPSASALVIAICAAALLVRSLLVGARAAEAREDDDRIPLGFLLVVAAILALSLALMFWTGPIAAELFSDQDYRQLRATAPWKHLGFVVGGVAMVFGAISLIEGRLRASRAAIAFLVALLLILAFDIPFDTLLLPPNGDW